MPVKNRKQQIRSRNLATLKADPLSLTTRQIKTLHDVDLSPLIQAVLTTHQAGNALGAHQIQYLPENLRADAQARLKQERKKAKSMNGSNRQADVDIVRGLLSAGQPIPFKYKSVLRSVSRWKKNIQAKQAYAKMLQDLQPLVERVTELLLKGSPVPEDLLPAIDEIKRPSKEFKVSTEVSELAKKESKAMRYGAKKKRQRQARASESMTKVNQGKRLTSRQASIFNNHRDLKKKYRDMIASNPPSELQPHELRLLGDHQGATRLKNQPAHKRAKRATELLQQARSHYNKKNITRADLEGLYTGEDLRIVIQAQGYRQEHLKRLQHDAKENNEAYQARKRRQMEYDTAKQEKFQEVREYQRQGQPVPDELQVWKERMERRQETAREFMDAVPDNITDKQVEETAMRLAEANDELDELEYYRERVEDLMTSLPRYQRYHELRKMDHTAYQRCTNPITRLKRQFIKKNAMMYTLNHNTRGIAAELGDKADDFIRKCQGSECFYCGSGEDLGFDRIDSDRPYYLKNIVICCTSCNVSKNDSTSREYYARAPLSVIQRHPDGFNFQDAYNDLIQMLDEAQEVSGCRIRCTELIVVPDEIVSPIVHYVKGNKTIKSFHTCHDSPCLRYIQAEKVKGSSSSEAINNGYVPCRQCRFQITEYEAELLKNVEDTYL